MLIFQNSWEKFCNEPLNDLFCCFAGGLVFLSPFSSVFNVYIFVTTLVIFSRAPQALLFTNSVCCFHTSRFKSLTSIHCQQSHNVNSVTFVTRKHMPLEGPIFIMKKPSISLKSWFRFVCSILDYRSAPFQLRNCIQHISIQIVA